MGILNLTPDSFSDGGKFCSLENALSQVEIMVAEGAHIIDVGSCSTAPENVPVSAREEIQRLSILNSIVKTAGVPVSVDTFRPAVARYALEQGAAIVNDESGLFTVEMAEVVKDFGAGWIFMHTGRLSSNEAGTYTDGVLNAVAADFANFKKQAVEYSVSEESILFDCGIGFGKSRKDDLEILNNLESLTADYSVLIGVSRKRIIGEITGESEPQKRDDASSVCAALCGMKGARALRVHNVKKTAEALRIANAVLNGDII